MGVGEELQRVARRLGLLLSESVGRSQELLGSRQDEFGLWHGLRRIVQRDGRPGEVGDLASLVGHRDPVPVGHTAARMKKSTVMATAVVSTRARSTTAGSRRTRWAPA